MMKNIISFCLFLFLFNSVHANDSTTAVYDTAQFEVRQFDQSKIEAHKADSDFQYGLRPEAELTLWQRFKQWLYMLLQKLFTFGTQTPIGKIIIYIICGAVVIYAIWKLSTIRSNKVFYNDPKNGLNYELHHEDIHQMDFEKLIEEAVQNKNFRLGIRLIYLYSLKHLSDRQLIDWQPGKTNYDYVNELEVTDLRTGFSELSYYFDYAWYGDFEVDQPLFTKVNNTFEYWRKSFKA